MSGSSVWHALKRLTRTAKASRSLLDYCTGKDIATSLPLRAYILSTPTRHEFSGIIMSLDVTMSVRGGYEFLLG